MVQGAFGALTVTLKLYPAIVTLHLLFGLGLLVLLALASRAPAAAALARGWTEWVGSGWSACCFVLQIALGGWVSTNYAVLVCQDFPTCQGSWWPAMDFETGFRFGRALGSDGEGAWLQLPALTAIHVTHRLGALLLAAALLVLAAGLWRQGQRRWAWTWLGLLAWQLVSGISNVVLGWPLIAALMHSAGAAAMVLAWTWLSARLQPQTRGQEAFA